MRTPAPADRGRLPPDWHRRRARRGSLLSRILEGVGDGVVDARRLREEIRGGAGNLFDEKLCIAVREGLLARDGDSLWATSSGLAMRAAAGLGITPLALMILSLARAHAMNGGTYARSSEELAMTYGKVVSDKDFSVAFGSLVDGGLLRKAGGIFYGIADAGRIGEFAPTLDMIHRGTRT